MTAQFSELSVLVIISQFKNSKYKILQKYYKSSTYETVIFYLSFILIIPINSAYFSIIFFN
jgi:hypothetical protein